jgi:hypothetical protein
MIRKSFTINPNFCLIDTNFKKPKSICVFDTWSLHHFFWQGFSYILLHYLFNVKDIKYCLLICFFLSIIHLIEEYLGNTNKISIEGIVIDNLGPLIVPKIKTELREIDNDYLDNSIGDVLSGLISNLLIILFWYKYKKLPYLYLLGIIPIFINLLSHAPKLYD